MSSDGAALTRSRAARALMFAIRVYQMIFSPFFHMFGGGCRFTPTCSAYALESVRKYGALRGGLRGLSRLLRCHPLHPGGFDPP